MKNDKELDLLFEERLQALENDQDFALSGSGFSEEDEELASLIRFAGEVRAVAHPQPSAAATRAARARVAEAAKEIAGKNMPGPAFRRAWSFGNLVFGAALLLIIAIISGAGFWWIGPLQARAASFADISGTVEVASANTQTWRAALVGEALRTGDRVRTGADGSATLVFFEGSRASFTPESELALTRVAGSWGDVLQVELFQQAGAIRYNVVPLRDSTAQFALKTPALDELSVQGTNFEVSVNPKGQTLVAVDSGKVMLANANHQVTLLAGEASSSEPASAPQPAAFRFAVNNALLKVDGQDWSMSKLSFKVNDRTVIGVAPQVGKTFFVTGRIVENEWVADSILPGDDLGARLEVAGVAQVVDAATWMVNGILMRADDATVVSGELQNGERILSEFTMAAGSGWQVSKIVKLEGDRQDPHADCAGTVAQPKGEKLATQFGVPYAEIMSWFCRGFGFGEIELAYGLSQGTGMAVADIFAMRRQGLGWGEISRATPAPSPSADAQPSQPSTILTTTATAPTSTLPEAFGTPSANCTGANTPPEAQALADDYSVTVDEIMGWFCQGFGFGEIKDAYDMRTQTGKPAADFFALKKSGLGWGEIKKMFADVKVNNGNNGNNGNVTPGNNANNGNNEPKSTKVPKDNNGKKH